MSRVEIIEGAHYWVKDRLADHPDRWVVVRREYGTFWIGGKEVSSHSVLVGPIPEPEEP